MNEMKRKRFIFLFEWSEWKLIDWLTASFIKIKIIFIFNYGVNDYSWWPQSIQFNFTFHFIPFTCWLKLSWFIYWRIDLVKKEEIKRVVLCVACWSTIYNQPLKAKTNQPTHNSFNNLTSLFNQTKQTNLFFWFVVWWKREEERVD